EKPWEPLHEAVPEPITRSGGQETDDEGGDEAADDCDVELNRCPLEEGEYAEENPEDEAASEPDASASTHRGIRACAKRGIKQLSAFRRLTVCASAAPKASAACAGSARR